MFSCYWINLWRLRKLGKMGLIKKNFNRKRYLIFGRGRVQTQRTSSAIRSFLLSFVLMFSLHSVGFNFLVQGFLSQVLHCFSSLLLCFFFSIFFLLSFFLFFLLLTFVNQRKIPIFSGREKKVDKRRGYLFYLF